MESEKRAKLLKLRMRVCLDEAPYIVLEQLGGTYGDALSLLIESAINKNFPADLVPRINQWSGKIIGPVEPSKSTVATADLSAWLATLHVHAQLDSNAADKDTLYPLGQAANTIASEKWPDTHAVLAEESWNLKFPGKPTPLLNGEKSDRAFLAAMRHESQNSLQQAIDSLLRQRILTLLDSTGIPTSEIQGAWVSKSELLQLIKEKKHLSALSEQTARAQANDDDKGDETLPEATPSKNDPATMWAVNKPERSDTLACMVYSLLKPAHTARLAKPKAREIMDAIAAAKPSDFVGIAEGDLKYLDSNGEIKAANLEAIRKRIERMTRHNKRTVNGR